ncbi:hypothetical protein HDV63DRAFT_201079 [Trichoderma sp. SZMC 28014]
MDWMRHSTVHMYAWSSYILAGSALRAYGGTRHPWPCGVWMHVRAYARRVCCFLVVFVDVDAVVYCTRYEHIASALYNLTHVFIILSLSHPRFSTRTKPWDTNAQIIKTKRVYGAPQDYQTLHRTCFLRQVQVAEYLGTICLDSSRCVAESMRYSSAPQASR